ncbi:MULTISPECIES: sulfite exporter TauE/SafE family protein [unclassified Carboxylicivirga]|uniref:sulfite exporter TauE/SafE family protein n=1 Tax=Carboxylicivirga TaxID=1628153 RepID=UPI003D356160
MEYIWIGLIVLGASLVKGITGFGFALISLPPLMFWYSPKELVPVLICSNLFASLVIVLQKKERRLVENGYRSLIVSGGLFTIVGALALKNLSENFLIDLMCIFFIVLSLLTLVGVKYTFPDGRRSKVMAGGLIGMLAGAISISGPPLALFLHSAKVDNQQFREIFAWFSIVTSAVALASYGFMGLLSLQTLSLTAAFIPILYLGTFVGKRFNQYLSQDAFKRISVVITLLSSLMLLVQ